MTRMIRSIGALCLFGMMAVTLVGCNSTPSMQAHDVTVALADDVAAGSDTYTVDLVGVSADPNDLASVRSMPINDYWAKSDLRNRYERKTFTFKSGDASPKTLPANDPIWEKWRANHAMNLFIIADLPDAPADRMGDQDLRRLVVPLGSDRWNGQEKLKVSLRRSNLEYLPKPLPEKKK